MIKSIARWKYWEIAAAGVASSLAVMTTLAFLANWVGYTWPASEAWLFIAYLILAAAASWIVTGIFIEAAFYKHRLDQETDKLMDLIAGYVTDKREDKDRG